MKYEKILFVILITSGINLFAQTGSINNTLGTGGSFIVKDGAADYLSLSQTTGNLSLFRNFELGGILNSIPTKGVLTKNGTRFLHNYQGSGTDGQNTFVGLEAGNFTMGGGIYYFNGSYNTGVGYRTLSSNTTGSYNTANGVSALYSNTTGTSNTANGVNALYSNTTGRDNNANGAYALASNTTGSENTANGVFALYFNTTGSYNTANGVNALYSNSTGIENSAFGYRALRNNRASYNSAFGSRSLEHNYLGQGNTALGIGSLLNSESGNNNTAVGNVSGSLILAGSNNIAIGYNAQVPYDYGDNQVRIGNGAITYAGIQVAWSITSDRRWKENINPSNLGLGFISKLNPVAYTRINDENQKIEYGLIAQELEQVLEEEGVENAAMLTKDGEGRYELRYNDLLAPMIKAIQDLNQEKDELKNELDKISFTNKQLAEQNQTLIQEISFFKEQFQVQLEKLMSQPNSTAREKTEVTLED